MITYCIVFASAILLTAIGQKLYKSSKLFGWMFFLLAIIGLTIFASMRDVSVGADTGAYKRFYDRSLRFDSLTKYLSNYDGEQLFYGLTYVVSHVFRNFRVLLAIVTALPLIMLYRYTLKINPKHITFALFIYLMTFFCTSLNVMRQVIAIFFTTTAFFELQKDKKIRAAAFILIASLFHITALCTFVIFPIKWLSRHKQQLRHYVSVILVFLALSATIGFLIKIFPQLTQRFATYIDAESNISFPFLALKLGFFGFISMFYSSYKNDRLCRNLYYFALLDVLFYAFTYFVQFGYRASYYFVIFYAFFIPLIYSKNTGKNRLLFQIGIIALLCVYWIGRVMIGYDAAVPYALGQEFLV